MPVPINAQAAANLESFKKAVPPLAGSKLSFKIKQLRLTQSHDQLQQLQTEAIVELYDVVKQIQEALWPILVTIPDTSGARQAAQGAPALPQTAPTTAAKKASSAIRR